MKVNKIDYETGCQWLLPVSEAENELLRFEGATRAGNWRPLRMKHIERLDSKGPRLTKRCDFPCAGSSGKLALNGLARDKIGALLERCGELLPIVAEGDEPYWVLNVTRLVDALDEAKTEFLRASKTGRVLSIKRHVFEPDALVGEQLFKLPQTPQGLIYATDAFVEAIKASGLTGLDFRPIWELKSN